MTELIRLLEPAEAESEWGGCNWTWRTEPSCVRKPEFRLATPHGHMDFCPEHIGAMIASLPAEWLEVFAYREPLEIGLEGDDIPF